MKTGIKITKVYKRLSTFQTQKVFMQFTQTQTRNRKYKICHHPKSSELTENCGFEKVFFYLLLCSLFLHSLEVTKQFAKSLKVLHRAKKSSA